MLRKVLAINAVVLLPKVLAINADACAFQASSACAKQKMNFVNEVLSVALVWKKHSTAWTELSLLLTGLGLGRWLAVFSH